VELTMMMMLKCAEPDEDKAEQQPTMENVKAVMVGKTVNNAFRSK
jgi:hypothetical protein